MPRTLLAPVAGLVSLLGAACAGGAMSLREPPPPPQTVHGALGLRVAYPRQDVPTTAGPGAWFVVRSESTYVIPARDSTFIFGSVGRGDARLSVNGQDIPVYPTGGWIAWVPLPEDSVARFDIVAAAGGDTARMSLWAPVARGFVPPAEGVWIDSTSLSPSGDRWIRPGEGVRLEVRAAPGALVQLRLDDSTVVPLITEAAPEDLPWGERAFGTVRPGVRPGRLDRYVGWHVGRIGPDPGAVLSPDSAPAPDDSAWAWVEAVREADTARARWPLRIGLVDPAAPPVVVVNDDTAGTGGTDSVLAGRPAPWGTYHWFFPTGTLAAVSGRWDSQVRLQLSRSTVAWVDAPDVQPLPSGYPPPGGRVRSLRLLPGPTSLLLRVPLPARIPYRVAEAEREVTLTLYGVAADVDWIQYSGTDSLVEIIAFEQPDEDVTVIRVTLSRPVWGYRTRWSGHDLELEIRRPPVIDRRKPLEGRLIALDAGHPPGGAIGPTGVRERDVNLEVALRARDLLEERGARVYLTRSGDSALSLAARPRAAEAAGAEILISIHANALPDGVNPFVNNGTSVYYYHPRSAPLARALDRALVAQLGFRDLGMGRGDLALARPTWMPAALTEGLFLMLPDQEAVLASREGQDRYARGLVEGLEAFLRERAQEQP
ncbi:MAG: N-acetylmuramoyl-L-alanine amidase [Gemmatimonadales bacterium]